MPIEKLDIFCVNEREDKLMKKVNEIIDWINKKKYILNGGKNGELI